MKFKKQWDLVEGLMFIDKMALVLKHFCYISHKTKLYADTQTYTETINRDDCGLPEYVRTVSTSSLLGIKELENTYRDHTFCIYGAKGQSSSIDRFTRTKLSEEINIKKQ